MFFETQYPDGFYILIVKILNKTLFQYIVWFLKTGVTLFNIGLNILMTELLRSNYAF